MGFLSDSIFKVGLYREAKLSSASILRLTLSRLITTAHLI